MNEREKAILRYISALDNADFQKVSTIWQQAENDSELMQALLEIHQEMKGHTPMIPYPISRQMNNHSGRWLRVAIAILIAAGVIMLALSLYTAESPVRTTPLQQGDAVITAENAARLEIVQTLGNGRVNGAQWSPDGQNLMAYGSDGFWIFSGDDLRRDPEIIDVGVDVLRAEYTEDSNQIIYRSREGISIRELDSGQTQLLIARETLPIEQFDYHNDLIAFIDADNIAGVWDIVRARPRFYFPPQGTILPHTVRLSDDGRYAAYAALTYVSNAGIAKITPQIFVSDIEKGRILYTLGGIEGHVNDINFFENEMLAAVDSSLYAWRLDSSQDVNNPRKIDLPDEELFGLVALDGPLGLRERFALHPGGEFAAIVTSNSHIEIININSQETLITLEDYWNPGFQTFSVKENRIAYAQYESSIEVYNLLIDAVEMWLPFTNGNVRVSALEFSPDRKLIAVAFNELTSPSGSTVLVDPYDGGPDVGYGLMRLADVYDLEFDLTAYSLYYATGDGRLMNYLPGHTEGDFLWQVPETQVQHIEDIALKPAGTQIALANGSLIHIYDFEAEDVVQTIEGHPYHISEMVYSPDGEWLATVDGLGTLMFWDTATWQELAYLPDQPGHTLAVSPDGGLVAVGGESIAIIDTATHEPIREIDSPAIITDVEFNDDGTRMIASSDNGKIYFWGIVEPSETGEINPTQTPEKMVPISN